MLHPMFDLLLAAMAAAAAVLISEDVQEVSDPVTVPTTTETLAVVGFPLSLVSDHAKALVRCWMEFQSAADATGVTVAIYEGADTSGRIVGATKFEAGDFTPGKLERYEIEMTDKLQNIGGAQYCLTVLQGGATADGTVMAALIVTTLLSG